MCTWCVWVWVWVCAGVCAHAYMHVCLVFLSAPCLFCFLGFFPPPLMASSLVLLSSIFLSLLEFQLLPYKLCIGYFCTAVMRCYNQGKLQSPVLFDRVVSNQRFEPVMVKWWLVVNSRKPRAHRVSLKHKALPTPVTASFNKVITPQLL